MKAAIAGVSDGGLQRTTISQQVDFPADGVPSTIDTANAGSVLRINLQDTVTGKKYRMTIPAYKPALVTDGSDVANFADGAALQALKTAIEANVHSEFDNPVDVLSGEFVEQSR
jgi:hypothetical protein